MTTNFERFNTELLMEIFDYLSFTDIFRAFFNLKQHINNAIRAYPASINLSETVDQNALIHGSFLCRALIASDGTSEEKQMIFSNINFAAIRAITFKNVHFTIVKSFFERLPMEQLESMTIRHWYSDDSSQNIDRQIWSAIAIASRNKLRYLDTTLEVIRNNVEQLLFELPSLQYATLYDISWREMLTFMYYTPNLYSFTSRISTWRDTDHTPDFVLPRLTYLNLHVERCHSFEKLHQLLSICPYLIHFTLRFWITQNNVGMVKAAG